MNKYYFTLQDKDTEIYDKKDIIVIAEDVLHAKEKAQKIVDDVYKPFIPKIKIIKIEELAINDIKV